MSRSRSTGGLTGLYILAVLATALATPAMAQLRFATGAAQGEFAAIEIFTTTVASTTNGDRVCGPGVGQECPSNSFPGIAPGANAGLVPPTSRPGALISGGTAAGDSIGIIADQWLLTTMNAFANPPVPLPAQIGAIATAFDGVINPGNFAEGQGPAAGTSPLLVSPLAAAVGTEMFMTNRFQNAASAFGATTVEPQSAVQVTFPAVPAATADNPVSFRVVRGSNPNGGFGGSIEVLQDAPGQIIRTAGTGQVWEHTNARCEPSLEFGECSAGLRIGTPAISNQARIYVGSQMTGQGGENLRTGFVRWQHTGWTTGTVTVVNRQGPETSFARAGTDVGGPARNVVLVTPSVSYGPEWNGDGFIDNGTGMIWTWDITFAPEPVSGAGVMAGVGLLGFLLRKRSRR